MGQEMPEIYTQLHISRCAAR